MRWGFDLSSPPSGDFRNLFDAVSVQIERGMLIGELAALGCGGTASREMMGWQPPGTDMTDLMHIFSHPIAALAIRAILGCTLIYIGRTFYADPLASFRGTSRPFPYDPWVRQTLRGIAGFCLWGGCFIVATAVGVQIFGLHGPGLAVALLVIATIATWILLPKPSSAEGRYRI
jgi:hypothetical protein